METSQAALSDAAIAGRLKEYRKSTKITRTAFALSVGYGSERFASYESGRVPLPYEAFLSIARKYPVNPVWLATGRGPMSLALPIKGSLPEFQIPYAPRALFRQVYAEQLARALKNEVWIGRLHLSAALTALGDWKGWCYVNRERLAPHPEDHFKDQISQLAEKIPKKVLRETSVKRINAADMKDYPTWEELRAALNKALAPRGMRAKLAKKFGVSQASMSEWLRGLSEPSGKITLQLLRWVRSQ